VRVLGSSVGVAGKDNKSPSSHQHDDVATTAAAAVRTLTPSTTAPTTAMMMMMGYNSPGTSSATTSGWYSTTQCAASRYRSMLLPTPEYHLPVPANCHMNGTKHEHSRQPKAWFPSTTHPTQWTQAT